MRILAAADRIDAPWKNGRGLTREIAVSPAGAGLDDFDWRISMAVVGTGGPFSHFPGIDRILSVLEGAMTLRIGDAPARQLDPGGGPVAFPGDEAVEADLIDGPVTDLNVMVRRGRAYAAVERLRVSGPTTLERGHMTFVLAVEKPLTLTTGDARYTLAIHDAALLAPDEVVTIAFDVPTFALVARLDDAG